MSKAKLCEYNAFFVPKTRLSGAHLLPKNDARLTIFLDELLKLQVCY